MKHHYLRLYSFMPDPLSDDYSWYVLTEETQIDSSAMRKYYSYGLILFGLAAALVFYSFYYDWVMFWVIVFGFFLISLTYRFKGHAQS